MLAVQDFLFRLMPKGAFKGMGFSKEEVRSLTRSMKDLDFTGGLPSVEAPVLLVCGGKDKQNMPSMEALQNIFRTPTSSYSSTRAMKSTSTSRSGWGIC